MNKVRVRFAPSPTGHLHIGGARVAIFNWLFARHNKGPFLVRIEDTDLTRSKKEYVDSILESLAWLDLMPDEPLIYQTARTSEYRKVIDQLLAKGAAYPCFCEPRDTEETVKDLEEGKASRYDGACRNKTYTSQDLQKPHAIRFKAPELNQPIIFNDLIRGPISVESDQIDDFVIWRRDQMPTYNFGVVVDDIFMGITHVVRGEDHISNTPKQILLYRALEIPAPKFAHLPLILGSSGQKLSKRDGAVSVIEYKKQGFLAEALFNYLVRLGWSHGDQEVFAKEEMINYFALEDVGKKGAIFDTKKLLWLNSVYLRKLSYEKFQKAIVECDEGKLKTLTSLWSEANLKRLFELYRERAVTLCELADDVISLAAAPGVLDIGLLQKWLTAQTKILLQGFVERAGQMEGHTHEKFLALAQHLCDESKVKLVSLAQPLRLALTGKVCSPGVFELMEVLPWEEVQKRINQLVSQLG